MGRRRSNGARVLALWIGGALVAAAAGCGGDSAGGAGDTDAAGGGRAASGGGAAFGSGGDSGGAAGSIADTGCTERLAPLPERGQVEDVGDGTPESCTEAALAAAIAAATAAEGGGTVRFSCGDAPHTITLTRELAVDGTLLIDGGGLITLSGGGAVRILNLGHYSELVVQRLTLRDGRADESGGAIHHPWYGTLHAIDVVFEDNRADLETGEIGGGAIFAGGLAEVVISGCQFIDNAASNGGAVLNRGSTLTVVDSVFRNNAATSYAEDGQYGNGGGLYIDGMAYEDVGPAGDLHLCGTVFQQNHAQQHGSAVFGYFYPGSTAYIDRCHFDANDFAGSPAGSGGLYHESVPLYLTNSTFSGNRSNGHAAAMFVGSTAGTAAHVTSCTFVDNVTVGNAGGIFTGSSPVTVTNCTFARNQADYAPAIFKGESATVTLANTIFDDNRTENEYSALACHESFADGGGNLQWPDTRNSGSADTPCVEGILFADPLLAELAADGALTPTMALEAGSPAIDAAAGCPETDQLGRARVGPCDAGAVEYRP